MCYFLKKDQKVFIILSPHKKAKVFCFFFSKKKTFLPFFLCP